MLFFEEFKKYPSGYFFYYPRAITKPMIFLGFKGFNALVHSFNVAPVVEMSSMRMIVLFLINPEASSLK